MERLFISTKDRPVELTILCKSLLHSDMIRYINEVVFLDDNSEDIMEIQRIFSAFSYFLLPHGIKTRFVAAKDGRSGINDSWDRIKYYQSRHIWMLNGDMMVFPKYFETCMSVYNHAIKSDGAVLCSGFNTPFHPALSKVDNGKYSYIKTRNVGGCSLLTGWNNIGKILECLATPTMNRGFDLHLGSVFDRIVVTNPSQSQHLGFYTGLNQISLAGFPGAFALVGVKT